MLDEHSDDKQIIEAGDIDTEKQVAQGGQGGEQVVQDEKAAREQGVKPAFLAKASSYPCLLSSRNRN
jgi:hypothetical protein